MLFHLKIGKTYFGQTSEFPNILHGGICHFDEFLQKITQTFSRVSTVPPGKSPTLSFYGGHPFSVFDRSCAECTKNESVFPHSRIPPV